MESVAEKQPSGEAQPPVRAPFWIALVAALMLATVALWMLFGGGAALLSSRLGGTTLPTDVGQPAPDFSLETAAGGNVRLSDLKGKVVLLNFWATWCTPCRTEMPEIQSVYTDYKDRGFEVLAIDLQEGPQEVKAFFAELGLSFPALLDRDGAVARQYLARALPASYLIDRQGIIRYSRVGTVNREILEEELRKLRL